MSAVYEKPSDRLKKNPQAWKLAVTVAEAINEVNRKWGLPEQSIEQLTNFEIVIDDDTTEEEEMMQYVEYYLRRGYSLEEAEKLAVEKKEWVNNLFESMK